MPKFPQPIFAADEAVAVHAVSGMQMRFESAATNPNGVTYIRVCDPDGDEIMYWSSDEWLDDPEVCIGAILGAFTTREFASCDRYAG